MREARFLHNPFRTPVGTDYAKNGFLALLGGVPTMKKAGLVPA